MREEHRQRVLAESHRPYRRRFASSGARPLRLFDSRFAQKTKFANAGFEISKYLGLSNI
jgi:hypothetical protein